MTLGDDYEGGDFYVATCSTPELWKTSEAGPELRGGTHSGSRWFRELRKTSWTTRPRAGDALVWGSRLIHGTLPVRSGTARKLIGFIRS